MKTIWKTGPQSRRKAGVPVKAALRYSFFSALNALGFRAREPVDRGKTDAFHPKELLGLGKTFRLSARAGGAASPTQGPTP